MGRNYYEVLGVPKGTSDEAAIKKAYKKAALKFHPDRPGGDKVKFQEVSEAFEVLSDPRKKQLYDRFGEAGLGAAGGSTADDDGGGGGSRQPQGNPFAGRGGQTFSFSTTTGGGGGHGNFHGSDPFSVFESIFGTMDVDQAMGTAGEGGDGFSGFSMRGLNGMRMGGSPMGVGGGFGGMAMPGMSSGGMPASAASSMRQAPAVEHTLNLALEELYSGTSKRVRITKKTANGEAQVDKTIVIKPGWKDGTRITFQREGDEQPNMLPSDIVFVIKTKPHPRFKREGNDLSCTLIITLEQALSGFDIPVDTLDGRKVAAREPGIASSSHETVIRGEGMPSQKDRRVRGDLTVRYCVEFPPPVRSQADKRKRQQAIADL